MSEVRTRTRTRPEGQDDAAKAGASASEADAEAYARRKAAERRAASDSAAGGDAPASGAGRTGAAAGQAPGGRTAEAQTSQAQTSQARTADARTSKSEDGDGRSAGSAGAPGRASGRSTETRLGKHVTIDLTQRLIELDRPTAQAYAASDSRLPNQPVYALVCDSGVPPRLGALNALAKVRGAPVMTPIEWGVVDWPEGEQGAGRRYALAFERPADPLLAVRPESAVTPMREDQLVERVVRPIARALRELESRGVTHRALSINNLFIGDNGSSPVLLGECASSPGGMLQPPVYETIDAMQAQPSGRGEGSTADDLYALGVLMALLLRGGDPLSGVDQKEIVARKIERGSYATLIERARVSLKLMEPLRGLLCDKVEERWQLAHLENWLGGKQQSPKQPTLPSKARRAFSFEGTDYWTCPALAHAMAHNWSSALRTLAAGDLEQWVSRALTDSKQSKALQATLAASRNETGGDDATLARVLIALDPAAPIRLRQFSARFDALAQALAVAWDDEQRRNAFVAQLRAKLPQRWLETQAEARPDHPQAVSQVERMTWLSEREQPGYGLERVLYEYNRDWPCQSALIPGSYVSRMPDLLPALEARAERDIPEKPPMDRHIAAFVGAHLGSEVDRVLQGLGDTRPAQRALAIVTLLAQLQRRHGPERLPALTEWMARHLTPLSEALHNREARERLDKRIARATKNGSLYELRQAVADKDMHREDARGFAAAQKQYAKNAREIAWLEDGGLTSKEHIAWASRNVSTALSAICAGLVVVVMTVVYVA